MFRFGICICVLSVIAVKAAGVSVVTIEKNGTTKCLGTVVKISINGEDPELKMASIVTAASCVYGVHASKLTVKATATEMTVDAVIVHPYYKPSNINYDVAILKVKWSWTPLGLNSLKLSKRMPSSGEQLQVWDPAAKPAAAKAVDWQSCQSQLGNSVRLTTKMLCATAGDKILDGAALTMKTGQGASATNEIVGVAFLGEKINSPKLFTNIANSEIYLFIEKYY